jgi:putative tryptophan/tyrosine transport system substrate-binding protein
LQSRAESPATDDIYLAFYVQAGGVLSYGPDVLGFSPRAAFCIDKILKGAKPGDLPVEQATRCELLINVKTTGALGLKMRLCILFRADPVIE